jgi:hypothetical protein
LIPLTSVLRLPFGHLELLTPPYQKAEKYFTILDGHGDPDYQGAMGFVCHSGRDLVLENNRLLECHLVNFYSEVKVQRRL